MHIYIYNNVLFLFKQRLTPLVATMNFETNFKLHKSYVVAPVCQSAAVNFSTVCVSFVLKK